MKPLISIITPNFNASRFIAETIQSVLNQTYENWEMLIVDDCSTDDSVEIIKQLQQSDSRIKLIQLNKNVGPAVVRNKGITTSKGSFLTFIDADDLWLPNFLETSMKYIKNSQGFVFASYHRFNENLNPIYKDFIVPEKVTYSDILKTNSISCLTAFIDVERLGKLVMPEILYRQDMGLWLKYLKSIDYAEGIQEPLAIYRIRKQSHSRNKLNLIKHQWNFYRKVASLSVFHAVYYFSLWIFYGFKKYYR